MPLLRLPALRLVRPAPLPEKVPVKLTPLALFVSTAAGSRASGTVPLLRLPALRLVRPAPLPENVPAIIPELLPENVPVKLTPLAPFISTGCPSTVMPAPPITSRTPPAARTLNSLFLVEANAPA